MAKKYSELRAKMSAKSRARSSRKVQEIMKELSPDSLEGLLACRTGHVLLGDVARAQLHDFVAESNRIEDIKREPLKTELDASKSFLMLDTPSLDELCRYAYAAAGARIRNRKGMDVRVGPHYPPPGGPDIPIELDTLIVEAATNEFTPFHIHRCYETLHPFMDGNGRSGRLLWAWQMIHHKIRPGLNLGFLHAWYYQSLNAAPSRS